MTTIGGRGRVASHRQTLSTRQYQRDERCDLVALLHDLDPDDWNKPTPCSSWTVTDVAAHLLAWERLLAGPLVTARAIGSARLLYLAARSRFSIDRLNDRLQQRSPDDPRVVLQALDAGDVNRWKWRFDRLSPGAQLVEYVIHHEDIRQAVGRPREIPPERLRIALAATRRLPGLKAQARPPRADLSRSALLLWLAGRGGTQ